MAKAGTLIATTALLSELSHVFCCILPAVVTLGTLLLSAGMIHSMPGFMIVLHDFIHGYELHILAGSFIVLLAGWWIAAMTERKDCHAKGCNETHHGRGKARSIKILKVATLLFAINASVYFGLHRGLDPAVAAETLSGYHDEAPQSHNDRHSGAHTHAHGHAH